MKSRIQLLLVTLTFLCLSTLNSRAQVGIGTSTPDSSAILDISSSNKGVLVPRTDTGSITSPKTGLLVYQTVDNAFYFFNGTNWTRILTDESQKEDWSVSGNSNTSPTTDFLGTSDNQAVVFKTNNVERARLHTNGNMSLGNSGSTYRFYVYNNDATTRYNLYSNNYSTSNSTKYGLYTYISNAGTGARYGIYNSVQQSSSSTGTSYGIYNTAGLYGTGIRYGQRNYLYTTGTNTSDIYGNRSYVTSSGSGDHYGLYNDMATSSTYNSDIYASFNDIGGTGNGSKYAVCNLLDGSGSGIRVGTWNELGGSSTGTHYGSYNLIDNSNTGSHYGTRNYLIGTGSTGTRYASYNYAGGSSNSTKYGAYNYVTTGTGAQYGSYNFVSSTGSGTHYGVYASAFGDNNRAIYGTNTHSDGWAGYFSGRTYISGDLGIGQSDPDRKLHVFSSTSGSQEASVLIESSSTASSSDATLGFKTAYSTDGNFHMGINAGLGNDFQICEDTMLSANSRILIERTTGEVGINTISPVATLDVSGTVDATIKSFKIDHPDDPANKTLRHFSMESDKGLVVYTGNILLNSNGEATIQLPSYFSTLVDEKSLSVLLTPKGKNPFLSSYDWDDINKVLTVYGKASGELSWQVSAERNDPTYNYRKQPVEAVKGLDIDIPQGKYIDAEAHGMDKTYHVSYQSREKVAKQPVDNGKEEEVSDLANEDDPAMQKLLEKREKRALDRAKEKAKTEQLEIYLKSGGESIEEFEKNYKQP